MNETQALIVEEKIRGTKAYSIRVDRVHDKNKYRIVLQPSTLSEKGEGDEFSQYGLIKPPRLRLPMTSTRETRLDVVSEPLKGSSKRVVGEMYSVSLKGDLTL